MSGRVVVITGGSSGIGHATALAFARRGDAVVVASRSEGALNDVVREIEELGGRAFAVVTDVAKWEDVEQLAASAAARFGRIDVWINNASIAEWSLIEEMSPDEMHRIVDVVLLGTMYGCRAALPHLRRAGGGTIINVASALSDRAVPLLSTYSASKAAVKSFSESLRMELRATNANVDVVVILPSSVNTPFYAWGRSKLGVRPHPVSVIYPPAAVADAICFAVDQPQRDVYVGAMGKLLSIAQRISPRAVDWYMLQGQRTFRDQYTGTRDRGESNLFHGRDESEIDGPFVEETRRSSFYTRVVEMHPRLRRAVVVGLLAVWTAAACRRFLVR